MSNPPVTRYKVYIKIFCFDMKILNLKKKKQKNKKIFKKKTFNHSKNVVNASRKV